MSFYVSGCDGAFLVCCLQLWWYLLHLWGNPGVITMPFFWQRQKSTDSCSLFKTSRYRPSHQIKKNTASLSVAVATRAPTLPVCTGIEVFSAAILTSQSRNSRGVISNVNDSWMLIGYPINHVSAWAYIIVINSTCAFPSCFDKSKCLLWKGSIRRVIPSAATSLLDFS